MVKRESMWRNVVRSEKGIGEEEEEEEVEGKEKKRGRGKGERGRRGENKMYSKNGKKRWSIVGVYVRADMERKMEGLRGWMEE